MSWTSYANRAISPNLQPGPDPCYVGPREGTTATGYEPTQVGLMARTLGMDWRTMMMVIIMDWMTIMMVIIMVWRTIMMVIMFFV